MRGALIPPGVHPATVALVTNPGSRRNRADPGLRSRLLDALGPGAIDLVPDGLAGWGPIAARILEDGIQRVAISGGDGSVHCLLTALGALAPAERWPAIGLLRAGTMNTLARNLGVRGRPEAIAARLATAPVVAVPCLRVGPHVGFLFGVGVSVAFLRLYYQGRRGALGAAALLLRLALGLPFGAAITRSVTRVTRLRASLDGALWSSEAWVTVGAQTVADLGLGFLTCPAMPREGALQAYGLPSSPWITLLAVVRSFFGRGMVGRDVEQAVGLRLALRSPQPFDYMVDGELHRCEGELDVQVGGAVRFLVPSGR
jgi:diacylglycerol kinase family enzyme